MAGLFDSLGALSPGDGYVDLPQQAPGSSGGIMGLLRSVLGPTQADQRMMDAANRGQIDPQIVQASPQDLATAQMLGSGTGAPYGYGSAAIPQAPIAAVTKAQAPSAPPVASTPLAVPAIPLGGTIQAAQPTANTLTPENDPTAGGTDPTAQAFQSTTQDIAQAAQTPETSKGLLESFADQARGIADKLTNLSPNASQALISTGLTMLAANDGTRNLGQVVGIGGAAGLNNYQSNVARQSQMALAQQKLQQEQYLKLRQQALEEAKYQNTPSVVKPGEGFITPGMIQQGRGPQQVGGAAVARTMKFQDADGNEYEQGVDYAGQPVGQPFVSKRADVGPLTGEQNTAISAANTEAETAKVNYGKVQDFIKRLSPTMVDPATGKEVPNPNYTPIAGGLAGSAQDAWFKLTGDMTKGQQFRKEIENSVVLNQLESYKAGIGGRLTNTDVGILQKGVPIEGANGETVRDYLQAYAKYQQGAAERAAVKSAYLQTNRGDMSPLRHDLTIAGVTYPKGSSWDDVVNQRGAVPAGTSTGGGSGGGSGNIDGNILARARQAARNGDSGAQAALRKQGLSW